MLYVNPSQLFFLISLFELMIEKMVLSLPPPHMSKNMFMNAFWEDWTRFLGIHVFFPPRLFPNLLPLFPLSALPTTLFPLIFSRGKLHLSESALLQERRRRCRGRGGEVDLGVGTLPLFSFYVHECGCVCRW